MPRVYKGNEIEMRVFIKTCSHFNTLSDLKLVFYTTNPEVCAIVTDNITLNGNIASVIIPNYLFGTMEDGVINYIVEGLIDNEDAFKIQRQSNYYLKTPEDYNEEGEKIKLQEKVVVAIMDDVDADGVITIVPDEEYDGMNKTQVDTTKLREGWFGEGYAQGESYGYETGYEKGNTTGYESGKKDQKELLETITIKENGTYEKEDGYNQVIVDIPDDGSYDEGYNQGQTDGFNKGYGQGKKEGYSEGYNICKEDGYEGGIREQNSKLEPITITENGTYQREDGYNEVVVSVEGGSGGECKLVEGYITTNGRHYPPQSSPNGIFVHDKAFYKDDWVMTDAYMRIKMTFQVPENYSIPTIYGLEGSDWSWSTFAARIYDGQVAVACGGEYHYYDIERGKFYTLEVMFDANGLSSSLGEWGKNNASSQFTARYEGMYEAQNGHPIYFGGMNNLQNGLWRTLDGIIGEIHFENANGVNETIYPEYLNYINGNGDVVGNWVGDGGRIWKEGTEGGADGFSSVYVDVPSDGYEIGFQDGINQQKAKLEPITITENGYYSREDGYSEINVEIASAGAGGGELTTLVATENGIYIPPKTSKVIRYESLTGDDVFVAEKIGFYTDRFFPMEVEFYGFWNGETFILSQGNPYAGDGWGLKFDNGAMGFYLYGTETGNFPIDERTWYKIKLDWDSATLYDANGNLIERFNTYGELNTDTKPYYPLTIGGTYIDGNPEKKFYGYIKDGIKIYDGEAIIDKIYAGPNVFESYINAVLFPNVTGQAELIEEEIIEGYVGYSQVEVNVQGGDCDEIIETARVLNITENGTYYSRYSDAPQVEDITTGIFPNGTLFGDYAKLNNKVFDTGIKVEEGSVLEFWYKYNGEYYGDAWYVIIGASNTDDSKATFQARIPNRYGTQVQLSYGGNTPLHINNTNDWMHIKLSAEGVWLNGEQKFDSEYFDKDAFESDGSTFYINSAPYCAGEGGTGGGRYANGYFGMVKIDDHIFIPTEDGFIDYETKELLKVVNDGSYQFTDNALDLPDENLIKTVNVNVQPKVNVAESGIKFGYSSFKEIPDYYDFKGLTDASYLFYYCDKLTTIPLIDTSNVSSMEKMFYSCGNLTIISQLDTSNVVNMASVFQSCRSLTTIPELDTSNVSDVNRMFATCDNLKSLPPLQSGKITSTTGPFYTGDMPNLTDVGGFIDLKVSWNADNYGFKKLSNLTYQSCINILNGLHDFTGNGETPNSSQGKLKVHQNFLDLVGDEISIAINKGWTITA